jgi:catechol 2,3-dioxygenase-like lactoylglutathione lyase family enzyme
MHLNHVDLQVEDVQATATFFERFFGFTHTSNRASPAIAILRGDGGFTLVVQRRKDGDRYPEGFHVGFIVDDEDTVKRMHDELARSGQRVSDVQKNGRGTMIYCKHDGFLVEVGCRPVTLAET